MVRQTGVVNKVASHNLSLGGNNWKTQHAMMMKQSLCKRAYIGVSSGCKGGGDNPIGFGAMSHSM